MSVARPRSVVSLASRLLLAAVFFWAGVAKIVDGHEFEQLMSVLGFVPDCLVDLVVVSVPCAELGLGYALLASRGRRPLELATVLLILFSLALLVAPRGALGTGCGCLPGLDAVSVGPLVFVRNLVLVGIAITGCYAETTSRKSLKGIVQ